MYGFKELMVLPVEAGEDELIKYRRMKHRKTDTTSESTDWVCGECNCEPCTCGNDIDEALTMAQRRKRSLSARKYQAKLKLGRKRAAMKIADKGRLMKRARKAARKVLIKKLMKVDDKGKQTAARKQEIEKRLDKMGPAIDRIAKKLLPQVRKAELAKKRGK